ncbi:hypothetical protein MNR01_16750 [Lysobacter sp. S4-A87]|uniref:hypothetical protein n=1 Tax=Lysobacter sp. S4-A87 TaxID=2925843 RepID=UPI001F5327C7|nr:hypothetical protein [Lysobacter sp. S4-A87]UNK49350.1 hypothetical protein MNR01_16750 [Lysobacter sp. S4-A87]
MNVETDPAVSPPASQAVVEAPATVAVATRQSAPWVTQAWRRMLREPSLLFSAAYLFVSFLGLWANYWFYRGFDLPILEYMQASDYLVAGLRDPVYALLLLSSVLVALLVSWPETFRRDHPERVVELRRRWWGRLVFMDVRGLYWKGVGLAPETGIVLAVFWGVVMASAAYVASKASYIREGTSGNRVEVTLAGDSRPQPHSARLLGTSGAFVFLWWPHAHRAEAVPIESIARLQTWIAPVAVTAKPAARPVGQAARR